MKSFSQHFFIYQDKLKILKLICTVIKIQKYNLALYNKNGEDVNQPRCFVKTPKQSKTQMPTYTKVVLTTLKLLSLK